ncbi:pentapeptide repeat-containing protein [Mastigocoleus sp. MO_188.B34]|uniref:pentapeptide repeat-containing protein n=1 Tax=Mastigocoleus sp. MO_188.B34 TaxID=3036635 RepID=UPI00262E593A|nr:pentapeptide repeat-containing protein [Mastigocoleus sp. MO_188.B34]MDJ0693880.1 pentapeptide repeat-containing protein [Mastigocoleus sp. MO_188.B34]
MTKSNEYYKALIKGIKKHSDGCKARIARMGMSDSLRRKVEKAREKRTLIINRDLSRPKTNIDISWQLWEEGFDSAYQEYLVAMENIMGEPASKIHQDILSFGGLDLEQEFKVKARKYSSLGLNALVGIPAVIAVLFGVATITDVKLDNPELTTLELGGRNLKRKDLKHIELRHTELRRTDLSGVDLSGVDLSGVDLSGAKLMHTDLSGAKLIATDLSGVDLRNANLSGVDLRSADLSGAKLLNADLSDTTLWDKTLGEAINLTPEQIKQAKNWEKAVYSPQFRKKLNLPEKRLTKKYNP